MKRTVSLVIILVVCVVAATTATAPDSEKPRPTIEQSALTSNYSTYINANNVLMFVTNSGVFGYDKDLLFGFYELGIVYPYVSTSLIESGQLAKGLQDGGGLWIGGKVGGEIRVAISTYTGEFVGGPMEGGTFLPDDPSFKVYKLYADSLESNPNSDYLNWPNDQGAPVNALEKPLMYGDQMLWSVYNDADPAAHTQDGGGTAPLGIEVQQTTWAVNAPGTDTVAIGDPVQAVSDSLPNGRIVVYPVDPNAITGDDYRIEFRDDPDSGLIWVLFDATTGDSIGTNVVYPTMLDGFYVAVSSPSGGVDSIREIETDTGLVSPPEGWNVMGEPNSSGDWLVSSYPDDDFYRMNWEGLIGTDDWEIRFTSASSEYYDWMTDALYPTRAPFEVWNIGSGTPDDPSDDKRIFFAIIDDDASGGWSWGDRIYPFEVEYFEPAPANAATLYTWPNDFHIGRIVFNDESGLLTAPVEGTVVRFTTYKRLEYAPSDTFTFSAPSSDFAVTGGEGNAVYMQYKLYNRGSNVIDSCYVGLYNYPEVGTSGSATRFGCDTLIDAFYAYDPGFATSKFPVRSPAAGYRIMYGPLVPSPGDSAVFDDGFVADYENLGMTSFINMYSGLPTSPEQTYNGLRGILPNGDRYVYESDTLTYMYSGDPVAGTGDLQDVSNWADNVAACGPFTFNPGDSQYVLVKFAVGQGHDRLESITKMKALLTTPFEFPTAVNDGSSTPELPRDFELGQNYPNPFNPSTRINYWLPQKAHVEIEVFNILGQRVTTLVNAERAAGAHTAEWDGIDGSGNQVSTGIYFYRIKAGDFVESKKMLLLK